MSTQVPAPDGASRHHVSLRDVADSAGVSFQTVSKVLKGGGRVAPATRERIMAAADELGYVPNTLARGLATNRTRTIGFISSGLASFVLEPLMRGADRVARARGYFTMFTLVEGGEEHAEQLLHQMIEQRVDGIVNAAMTMQNQVRYAELLRRMAPIVSLYSIHRGGVSIVGPDDRQIGALATRQLLAAGHQRIGTIVGDTISQTAKRGRTKGWEDALEERGIQASPAMVDHGRWTAEGGYEAMHRLMNVVPDLTAVFAHNDYMAVGAIKALEELGLRVPQDFAVVGCDDIDLAPYTRPPLTTVRMDFENNGAKAMGVLLDHLAGLAPLPERVVTPVHLVVRESCGAPLSVTGADIYSTPRTVRSFG